MAGLIIFILNTVKNVVWPGKLSRYHDVVELLSRLSTGDPSKMTDDDCNIVGLYVHSDGCTRASQLLRPECRKHDFRYRTHLDFYGRPTTKWETDLDFLLGMVQRCNPFRRSEVALFVTLGSVIPWFFPFIWLRFFAVVFLGSKAWNNKRFCRP